MPGQEFDALVHFFDQMAQTEWLSAIHQELVQLTGDWSERDVLDVGCGTGRLLLRGAMDSGKIVGVDLSEKMIETSIRNAELAGLSERAEFYVGDAYDLPFADNQFDLTLSTCVMFLLPDPMRGMKEMLRVTRPDGKITMLNPSARMNDEAVQHYIKRQELEEFEKDTLLQWTKVATRRHRYSEEGLYDLLAQMGAKNVTHYPVLSGLALITMASK